MSWAQSLQPAMLADQAIGTWASGQLSDIQQGAYPGLQDNQNLFRSLIMAPFQKQAGGGVDNIGYRNQLAMGQYSPARGNISSNALSLANMFANLLTGDASSMLDISTMIQQGRNSNSGGLLGTLGL